VRIAGKTTLAINNIMSLLQRRILVGTPALNGQVDCWYADSMFDSIRWGYAHGIVFIPSILHNESILPMARNELIASAYHHDMDLVFIDADERWHPKALLDVVTAPYDVVGLPYVKKTDEPHQYNLKVTDLSALVPDSEGYCKVQAIGTGFLKISHNALSALWESHPDVTFRGKTLKAICEYGVTADGDFIGEDITLCNKLRALGYDIMLNTNYTVSHTGTKTWHGDFQQFLQTLGQ
jgi:hypothetical protein